MTVVEHRPDTVDFAARPIGEGADWSDDRLANNTPLLTEVAASHANDAVEAVSTTGHWEHYWVDDLDSSDETTRRIAQAVITKSAELLEVVARGPRDFEKRKNPNSKNNVTERRRAAGNAAVRLYESLGPDNEMYGGEHLLVALAGRQINKAINTDIIPQTAYDEDFLGSEVAFDNARQPATTDALFDVFDDSSKRQLFYERYMRAPKSYTKEVLNAAEMLAEASYVAKSDKARHTLQEAVLFMVDATLHREPSTFDVSRAAALAYDMRFAEIARQPNNRGVYRQELLYSLNALSDLLDGLNQKTIERGFAHEHFAASAIRVAVYEKGLTERFIVRSAYLRSDSPVYENGVKDADEAPNRRHDLQIIDMQTGEKINIQVKIKIRPSDIKKYDLDAVRLMDIGMSKLVDISKTILTKRRKNPNYKETGRKKVQGGIIGGIQRMYVSAMRTKLTNILEGQRFDDSAKRVFKKYGLQQDAVLAKIAASIDEVLPELAAAAAEQQEVDTQIAA